MNCKRVRELLPLYVSRDLEEERAQLVTTHVQSCAECAGSLDEYHETRQLLQEFAPPPFSEAVYDGIRRRVLREIRREFPATIAPALPRFVASLFRPRFRWVVATALLLAVSLFAFYFIANRGNDRRQVTDVQPNAPPQTHESAASSSPSIPSPRENNGPPFKNTSRDTGANTTIAGSGGHTHPSPRRKSRAVAPDRQTAVALNTPDTRSITTESSPEGNNLAEPDAVPARDPAASEKTLRVEMQTKDRNIRIIWFSAQRTKKDSPGKFSKGI